MWLEEFIILCEERDSKSHGQSTIGGTLRMLEEHKRPRVWVGERKTSRGRDSKAEAERKCKSWLGQGEEGKVFQEGETACAKTQRQHNLFPRTF